MSDRIAWTAEKIVDWRRWLANRDFAVTQGAMGQALDEIEARGKEIQRLQEDYRAIDLFAASLLGISTYEQAGGKEIGELVRERVAKIERLEAILRECAAFIEGSDGETGEFGYSSGVTDDQHDTLAAKIRAELGDGA